MSWQADVLALREAVAGAVSLAWPGVLVTTERPEGRESGDLAWVALGGLEFSAENGVSDLARVRFVVRARFGPGSLGVGGRQDGLLSRAGSLRSGLLGLGSVGGVGFGGLVDSVVLDGSGPGGGVGGFGSEADGRFEMEVVYSCGLMAGRS